MRYLIVLIILVPALDIGLLLFSGKTLGAFPTLALIILTGVLGAYLAKKQGIETIRKAQQQLRSGQIPGDAVLDGICILVGGTLLLTPGFLTDALGFLLLIPYSRRFFKWMMILFFRKRMMGGKIKIIK